MDLNPESGFTSNHTLKYAPALNLIDICSFVSESSLCLKCIWIQDQDEDQLQISPKNVTFISWTKKIQTQEDS